MRFLLSVIFAAILLHPVAAQSWKPAPVSIQTPWADKVNPENAWKEYPRPQLVRDEWENLNGLWDYAIVPKNEKIPEKFQGKILVPFAVESSLSGVGKPLLPEQEIWYKKSVSIPERWKGRNVILHFGAVDYVANVYVNGKKAFSHTGSSDPFSVDITSFLKPGKQEIAVSAWDPTDSGIQPRGKQTLDPRGFWYTAVSGIWQTVWMEPVSETGFQFVHPVPDIDQSEISFHTSIHTPKGNEKISFQISKKGKPVLTREMPYKEKLTLAIPDPEWWAPGNPALYDVKITLSRNGKITDEASTYFAMRKIALGKDEIGNTRLMLNNLPLFQWGVLDQGWWPESLLTPPSDEAMKYDMVVLQNLGFNMIRKHIKVEPARFYYHADTMGILLWQDMPSGFLNIQHPEQHVKHDAPEDWKRPAASARDFEAEWKSIMDHLRFFPSIVTWVPFNEGWGQYDTKRVAGWTINYDPSRLVNATSGWTDRKVGDFYDAHQYPGPAMEPLSEHPDRAMVLGEFGGLGWPVKGHLWNENKRNWGYRNYASEKDLLEDYRLLMNNLQPLLAKGLSAAIYTQTSDVEGEVNGLMTYDRRMLKMPEKELVKLHQNLLLSKPARIKTLVADSEESKNDLHVSTTPPVNGWLRGEDDASQFLKRNGPMQVERDSALWAMDQFSLEKIPANTAMKIYAQGDLIIYLNGKEIYNRKIATKRHYDELNITGFSHLLKTGNNTICLELKNAVPGTDFDFGVYCYD